LEADLFYFTFILQVESVVGVATTTGHLYFKTCCYYTGDGSFRLSVFSDVPTSHREEKKKKKKTFKNPPPPTPSLLNQKTKYD